MRATITLTTLTSMTVLALLCQVEVSAAQTKSPEPAAAQGSAKSDAAHVKKGVGRLGSLSPDEARRAARARKRAAAAFAKTAPVRTAEPAKTAEQIKPTVQTKTTVQAKKTEPAKTNKEDKATIDHTSVASKPAAGAERVAARPTQDDSLAATGRSVTVDAKDVAARSTKRSVRTAERASKHKARREARRTRDRNRVAGDLGRAPRVGDVIPPSVRLAPVPSRYWRVGRGDRPVVVADGPGPGYSERVVVVPASPWRYAPGPAYVAGYPPYPQAYDDGGY